MNIENQKLVEDWGFIRGNTIAFLEGLSDKQLTTVFRVPALTRFSSISKK